MHWSETNRLPIVSPKTSSIQREFFMSRSFVDLANTPYTNAARRGMERTLGSH